ncbi:hypothetical protein PGSY75_1444100, partial [Plasmodium gaboni]
MEDNNNNNETNLKTGQNGEQFYFLNPSEFIRNKEKVLKEFITKKYDDIIKQNKLSPDIRCTYFQCNPKIVIFTTYTPFQKYESVVSLKNVDTAARRLNVQINEDNTFKVIYITDIKKKIAPGMLFNFKIEFYPKSQGNYEYDLEVHSEGKYFLLPIRCMNDQIILNVQDEVIIDDTPIYMKSEKNISIKNIGQYENKFEVIINPPFYLSVSSSIHTLKRGEIEH